MAATITILAWQRIPYEVDEEPGMPTYRLSGTANHRVFIADVSVEIDGRDCEFKHVAGVNLENIEDYWEPLLLAIADTKELTKDMMQTGDLYRGVGSED